MSLNVRANKGLPVNEPALLAEVTRAGSVESRHRGHVAIVDAAARVLFSAGDPGFRLFPRSSLKPLQALAVVASGAVRAYRLSERHLAVMCASHAAEPRHRQAVAEILVSAGAAEEDLHCGPHEPGDRESRDDLIREGRRASAIHNNCSGKHAGMLLLARMLEAPLRGYWEVDHPVQIAIQAVLRIFCDLSEPALHWGVDGCGVPAYRMPLSALALGFARLARPDGLPDPWRAAACEVTAAMMACPGMVRGRDGWDTVLMSALPGQLFSKGGAEGCQAMGLPSHATGIAIKIEDGSARALPPVSLQALQRAGALPHPLPQLLKDFQEPEVRNTRDEVVGRVRGVLIDAAPEAAASGAARA